MAEQQSDSDNESSMIETSASDSPVSVSFGDVNITGRGRRGSRGRSGSRGRRARGQSRGRGGGSRSRSRSRARASGSRVDRRDEEALENVNKRQETLMNEVNEMSDEERKELCQKLVREYPYMILEILKPATRHPGGYHPGPGQASPDWCVCRHCREMPTQVERQCCGKENCVTLLPDFQVLILDEGVLALARLYRRDILVFDDEADIRKANRHQAYRQFVLWTYGRLIAGDRRVVPSCSVWKIRDRFPDPFGQYTGFKPSRLG